MKRLFSRSCLGLLAIGMLGCLVMVFVFTMIFQQSQAGLSNVTTTQMARATQVYVLPRPFPLATTSSLLPSDPPGDVVTIQVQQDNPTAALSVLSIPPLGSAEQISPTITAVLPPVSTPTDVPRNSGTSTYPLTVTAEVMFALTDVARYQSGVAATRTAIAAESQSIYATLTAGAPVSTEVNH